MFICMQILANLLKNIKLRGRDYEQNITAEYLEKIKKGYFSFLKQINSFPILIIDINKIDFVKNSNHYRATETVYFSE